jgi:hypothetical protein
LQRGHGAGLGVGVGAGARGLHEHDRTRAVARGPHAILRRRLRAAVQPVHECRDFTGWIVRQQFLGEHACRRAEQIEAVAERLMQAVCGKALRRHRRAQHIAMLEDELLVARLADGLAVVDRGKLRVAAQAGGHVA